MSLLSRLVLAVLLAFAAGCRSDLPETPYSASTDCIELRFGGARASGGQITLGQLVARALSPERCGSLANLRTRVFADTSGDGEWQEGEPQQILVSPPKEFMRSLNISARTIDLDVKEGPLRFLVEVETTSGEKASVSGPVE